MKRLKTLAALLKRSGLQDESFGILKLSSGFGGLLSDEELDNLARIAQEVYDEWEQNEEGWSESHNEIGYGGICHIIAEKIVSYLYSNGKGSKLNSCTVSDPFVQHVYVIAFEKSEGCGGDESDSEEGQEFEFDYGDDDNNLYDIWSIDIPYSTYEDGGGFTWTKIKDVKFTGRDVVVDLIESCASRSRLDEIIGTS
jgi:hypothetical protein